MKLFVVVFLFSSFFSGPLAQASDCLDNGSLQVNDDKPVNPHSPDDNEEQEELEIEWEIEDEFFPTFGIKFSSQLNKALKISPNLFYQAPFLDQPIRPPRA